MPASLCRACTNHCRLLVEVEDGRLTRVAGDPSDPVYKGFSCIRGISAPAFYNHPDRLLHAMKREPDGSYTPIPLATALDEIAAKLVDLRARHGPRAIATYWGMMAVASATMMPVFNAFMGAIGTPMNFNASAIDKPGRSIAQAMVGTWQAPRHGYDDPDAILLVGINPLTSFQGAPMGNPARWYRDRLDAGASLFVIDPRRTDIARRATIHLQSRPGTDAAIVAAIIKVILDERLEDAEFLADNVSGRDSLAAAVAPFTPQRAAEFAGVDAEAIVAIARTFGSARRGTVVAGTGPAMSGHGTLVDYLLIALDTICGNYLRAGDRIRQPGVLMPPRSAKAQASPPRPAYGFGERMHANDISGSAAGMPTGVLHDEMLHEGEGRVRALISCSGNPANAWPDHDKTLAALQSLELLVQIDPWMSDTARLAHYVLPPKMPYETPSTTVKREFGALYAAPSIGYEEPFAQYFPALLDPPSGSELVEEWEMFYELARRMGQVLEITGGDGSRFPLDPDKKPSSDELLEVLSRGSRVPLGEVKKHPDGAFFPGEPLIVQPKEPGWTGRLDLGNPDMMADLAVVADEMAVPDRQDVAGYPFRLLCRRVMATYNSSFHDPSTKRGRNHNPAYMHPHDIASLGLAAGTTVEVASRRGSVRAIVEPDANLRRGMVSMSHGFGNLHRGDPREAGVNVNRLLGAEGVAERYSGQPLMSNVPVTVRPLRPGDEKPRCNTRSSPLS